MEIDNVVSGNHSQERIKYVWKYRAIEKKSILPTPEDISRM